MYLYSDGSLYAALVTYMSLPVSPPWSKLSADGARGGIRDGGWYVGTTRFFGPTFSDRSILDFRAGGCGGDEVRSFAVVYSESVRSDGALWLSSPSLSVQ